MSTMTVNQHGKHPRERSHWLRCLCGTALLFAIGAASAVTGEDAALPTYRWEAEKIYRYQFHKRADLTHALTQKTRVTEVECVLVIEVKSVDEDGYAEAEIRYLTPQISLPPMVELDSETGERKEEPTRSANLARGIRTVLNETQWPVKLAPDGSIRLIGQPPDWRNWMRRVEQVSHWPKRVGNELGQLLDTHFTIGRDQASDDEWLPVLRKGLHGKRVTGLRAFRPRRRTDVTQTRPNGFADLRLWREPEEKPADVNVPLLDSEGMTLTLSRENAKTLAGKAVFDTQLGLLDSAEERYQVTLVSHCKGLTQRADMKVSYKVKRLVPPLRGASDDEESEQDKGRAR